MPGRETLRPGYGYQPTEKENNVQSLNVMVYLVNGMGWMVQPGLF